MSAMKRQLVLTCLYYLLLWLGLPVPPSVTASSPRRHRRPHGHLALQRPSASLPGERAPVLAQRVPLLPARAGHRAQQGHLPAPHLQVSGLVVDD